MEELSIEDKANRYDKAIEIAKSKIKNDKNHVLYEDDVIEIFPELKESEDERIRKELIDFVKSRLAGFPQCEKYIAWLEKQGCKDSQVTLPPFTFDDILALQCCMETVKKVQEDKDLYEKLKDLHGRVYDAYQLEKQEKTQQEPTSDHWHEQDNTIAFTLMRDIEQVSFLSKEGKDERISWLNSLEDRFSNQESNKDHWQDVRERAAIAAMQGYTSCKCQLVGTINLAMAEGIADQAIMIADTLVKKLKGERL